MGRLSCPGQDIWPSRAVAPGTDDESGLIHDGTGPAPVLFGSGYVDIGIWRKLGLLISIVNVAICLVVGGLWWKVLGLW